MSNVTTTIKDGVAVIALDDGKANALGAQMWADLNAGLDEAEAADAIVVITGREGMMSGGFDLKEMGNGPQDALELTSKGSKFARRIMAHPRPVIMAAPGHTIAMGAFLALACDYSMIKEGDYKVGLNETLIGMTMHNFGKGAMHAGFFDRVVPAEQWEMAIPMAGQMFGQLNPKAFKETKLRSRKEIFAILDQAIEDDLDPEKVHAM